MKKTFEHNGYSFEIAVYPNHSTTTVQAYNPVLHDEIDKVVALHKINGVYNGNTIATTVAEDRDLEDKISVVKDYCIDHINRQHPQESRIITKLKKLGFE